MAHMPSPVMIYTTVNLKTHAVHIFTTNIKHQNTF